MATVINTRSTSADASLVPAVRGVMTRLSEMLAARRRRNEILRELHKLDQRDLADMGISEYDFDAISRGAYRR